MALTKRPSQRDIAQRANVSQTAVSMVLNGKTAEHGISKETEEKVLAAITELGYVPNISARSLRTGRNGLIGVHTFENLFPTSQHSYYFEFMVGVEEKAIELGQDLVLLTSAHQHEGDQSIYRAGNNRLRLTDGAVILGFNQDSDELSRLAEEGFPFVFIGRREKVSSLMPYVTVDYAAAMASVVTEITAHGHRRVAYLGLDARLEPRVERLDSFHLQAAEADLEICDESMAAPGDLTSEWFARIREAGVTVVLVESSGALREVAALAAAAGVSIPRDLSLVCLDTPGASNDEHDWTHIVIPRREMGGRAVSLLLELLNGQSALDHREEFTCQFHSGATLSTVPQLRRSRRSSS